MAFGAPTRYLQLDPSLCGALVNKAGAGGVLNKEEQWDEAVEEGSGEYSHRMHNICLGKESLYFGL